MQTSLKYLVRNAKHLAATAIVTGSLLLGGCASAATGNMQTYTAPHVQADVIYVYSFDATSSQVKMDSGLAQEGKTLISGESFAQKENQTATDTREQVANEIVRELQSMGLRAVRADHAAPPHPNALVVEGNFQTIDEGKRRRRIMIGLGAGKSEVSASIKLLYKSSDGKLIPLQSFTVEADSGHMPGVAETAGVGAVAGNVATAAATGGSVHGVSEAKHNSVIGDAKKLGDSIAKQVAAASVANGWMLSERTD
jgi:outer membrane murein-binding lipoprotein Lpp